MSRLIFSWLFVAVVINFFNSVSATVTFSFLPSDWYSWFWHGHVVVNNYIYIDGGEIWSKNGTSWNNFTMAIDLSKDWSTSTVKPIVSYHTNGYSMLTRGPSVWHDAVHNKVFWYGGWSYYDTTPSVWSFTPRSDGIVSWGNQYSAGINVLSNGTSSFNDFTNVAGALSVSTQDKFYSLGGYMPSTNDPAESNLGNFQAAFRGLVEYDFASSTWTNTSSVTYQHAGYGVLGEGIHVPIFGKAGILVFLGGDAPTGQAWGVGSIGSAMVAFNSITVYDIDTGTFYQQTAYGSDIPIKRSSFCAVGVGAADNSTWEIFIYGGYQGGILNSANLDSTILDDLEKVYILTLPAFEWVLVPSQTVQRHAHQCTVIGNRQMLSTGGVLLNNANNQDPWVNGMGLFDLVNLTWSFAYNSSAEPYVRSDLVVGYYDSSTSPYPSSWDASALKGIFKDTRSANGTGTAIISGNGAAATPTSTSTSSSTSSPASSSKSLSTGTIAGAAIAGVAGLAVILSVAFLLWRRPRKQNLQQKYESAPYYLSPDMQHYQPGSATYSPITTDPRSAGGNTMLTEPRSAGGNTMFTEPRSAGDNPIFTEPPAEIASTMIMEARGDDGAVEVDGEEKNRKGGFWFGKKPLIVGQNPVELDAGDEGRNRWR